RPGRHLPTPLPHHLDPRAPLAHPPLHLRLLRHLPRGERRALPRLPERRDRGRPPGWFDVSAPGDRGAEAEEAVRGDPGAAAGGGGVGLVLLLRRPPTQRTGCFSTGSGSAVRTAVSVPPFRCSITSPVTWPEASTVKRKVSARSTQKKSVGEAARAW